MSFKLNRSSYPPKTNKSLRLNAYIGIMSLRRTPRVAPEAFVNAEGACRKAPFETPCPRVSHNSGPFVLHDDFRALRTKIKDPVRLTQ